MCPGYHKALRRRRSYKNAMSYKINSHLNLIRSCKDSEQWMFQEVSDLGGVALDWAVATCEKLPIKFDPMGFGIGPNGGFGSGMIHLRG